MSEELSITGVIDDFPEIKPGVKEDGTAFRRVGFKISGKRMSVFDNILPNYEDFTKGNVVDVVYSVNGKYNNIQKMSVSNSMPTEPANVSTSAPAKLPSANMDRDKENECSIVTQVIIKKTVDLVCAGKTEYGHMENTARQLATIYKGTKEQLLK